MIEIELRCPIKVVDLICFLNLNYNLVNSRLSQLFLAILQSVRADVQFIWDSETNRWSSFT